MATCKKIKREIERVCIGSMNKLIKIKVRDIQPPEGGSVDFNEVFTDLIDAWAMIKTIDGVQIFDGSNIVRTISHDFYIRYFLDMTFAEWILLPVQVGNPTERYFDVIKVENLNEENRFYRLRTAERGPKDKPVNRN